MKTNHETIQRRIEMQQLKYGFMTLEVEIVTPGIAERWLTNNTANRRVRPGVVAQYARDMKDGNWRAKPIAICFDESGSLGNGQHTLHAIVESNVPQQLLVARNVSRATIAVMDMGVRRTISDIAHFLGADMDSRSGAIARVIVYGTHDDKPRSFEELFAAYQEHQGVIDFVMSMGNKKCGLNASVLAVCARAAYTESTTAIERFVDVLKTGVVADASEHPAIRLRDFVRSLRGGTSRETRRETYQKAETALYHFLRKTMATKLYGTVEELFPIPGERPQPRTFTGETAAKRTARALAHPQA